MILVTGADGIVGRAVCSALRDAGRAFVPVVRVPRAITPPDAFLADLTQEGALDPLLERGITSIVHLAAAVTHSARYPDSEASSDLTRRMDRTVHAFGEAAGAKVCYMSSCGLYNRTLDVVKHEDDASQIRVESPYFAAKLDGEHLFTSGHGSPILRLAAPIGPGQKPSVVLSRFIAAARVGRPIQIWGSGSREQNFVDVRDVAELILKVIDDPRPGVVNVAGASPTTMSDLAKAVIAAVGSGTFEFPGNADPRDGETARYSIVRAGEWYGWSPRRDLIESCRMLVEERFEEN